MRYKRPAYTARKFLAMPRLKKESIKRMTDGIDKECTLFCAKNGSILTSAKSKYTQFNWNKLLAELQANAPTLLAVLKAASKYDPSSIKSKIRLCVAASVLLFFRSQVLNAVQIFIGGIKRATQETRGARQASVYFTGVKKTPFSCTCSSALPEQKHTKFSV